MHNSLEYFLGTKHFHGFLKVPCFLFNLVLIANILSSIFELPIMFLDENTDFIVRLTLFFTFLAIVPIFSLFLSYILQSQRYETCLKNAINSLRDISEEMNTNQLREETAALAVKLYKHIAISTIPTGLMVFTVHGAYNLFSGQRKLIFPNNLFGLEITNNLTFIVGWMHHLFINLLFSVPMVAASGVAVVVLVYVLANLKQIEILLDMVQEKPELVGKIIDLHAKTMELVNDLDKAFSWTIFALESVLYACFLLAWTANFYSQSSFIFFVYMFSLANQYFTICLGNEKLQHERQHLLDAIYNILWYNMSPNDGKFVILMLQMTQRPSGISAGPFHKATFATFLKTTRLLYSFVLLLNNSVLTT